MKKEQMLSSFIMRNVTCIRSPEWDFESKDIKLTATFMHPSIFYVGSLMRSYNISFSYICF